MNPPDADGHEGTPEHGMHDGARKVDQTSEGTYVDSQEPDDEETVHHHPEGEGSYVDVQPEGADEPVHPDAGSGHYEDIDFDDPDEDDPDDDDPDDDDPDNDDEHDDGDGGHG